MDLTFAASYNLEGDTLSGVVHVFGTRTLRDGVWHEFAPESVGRSKPIAFYSHDTSKPLAKPSIEVRDSKLHYSMQLGHQSYANDLRENVVAGLMDKMSFGVIPGKWKDTRGDDGRLVRLHTQSEWFDISPVTIPAFDKTSAQLHAASAEWAHSQAVRARARVQEAFR